MKQTIKVCFTLTNDAIIKLNLAAEKYGLSKSKYLDLILREKLIQLNTGLKPERKQNEKKINIPFT